MIAIDRPCNARPGGALSAAGWTARSCWRTGGPAGGPGAAAVRRLPAGTGRPAERALGRAIPGGHRLAAISPSWSCWRCRWPTLYADHWSITGPRRAPGRRRPTNTSTCPAATRCCWSKPTSGAGCTAWSQLAIGRAGEQPVCRCHATLLSAVQRGDGPGRRRACRAGSPAGELDKRQVMQLADHAAAGVDLFVPGAGGRPALRPLQQMRRAAAGLSRRRTRRPPLRYDHVPRRPPI